jgi:hypothetical protein
MGRFDALTELEENQVPAEKPSAQPLEDNSLALDTPQPQPAKKPRGNGKKSATRQPSKSINVLQSKQDKFDKYSTYLRPGYKKVLKSLALERDCKDYEVLDEALTLFFEARNK